MKNITNKFEMYGDKIDVTSIWRDEISQDEDGGDRYIDTSYIPELNAFETAIYEREYGDDPTPYGEINDDEFKPLSRARDVAGARKNHEAAIAKYNHN